MVTLYLISLAGVLFIIQLIYLFTIYTRVYKSNRQEAEKDRVSDEQLPPLSVIISAHNQGEELKKNLPALLTQDYPNYEVVVIDDNSNDDTKDILKRFAHEYSHLYHSFTSQSARYISHKKLSLTLGIKAAKNDCLVFTEPQCTPQSNQWLRLMGRHFTPTTDIVLGYSNYISAKGERKRFITFDTLISNLRFLGLGLKGKAYMGSGRNMGYRKSLFLKNKGFASNLNYLRGEDHLFINEFATRSNTKVEASAGSAMEVTTYNDKADWKEEKQNFLVSRKRFQFSQRSSFVMESCFNTLFYCACVAGMVISIVQHLWIYLPIFPLLILLYWVCFGVVINLTAKKLGSKQRYILTLPFLMAARSIRTFGLKVQLIFTKKREYMRN